VNIHSSPVSLPSGQNSKVYKRKRPRHKWSNLLDRAISRSFGTCEKSAKSIDISVPWEHVFYAFQTISTRLGIICRDKIFFRFTMEIGWT